MEEGQQGAGAITAGGGEAHAVFGPLLAPPPAAAAAGGGVGSEGAFPPMADHSLGE